MKIAIIGTRGVPNFYGGFEQFAEFFSLYLINKGHDVYVYCQHNHPYKENTYKGVKLIKCFDPEHIIGTAGQFVYDFLSILHVRRLKPDIVLNLGYTSSAIFLPMLYRKVTVVTNMDGMEWKRSKYSRLVQRFIKFSEKLAVRYSHRLIADSEGIKTYLQKSYKTDSDFIAYGAEIFPKIPEEKLLNDFNLTSYTYDLVIARMEPENNIYTILEGKRRSNNPSKIIIIGNYNSSRYGKQLYREYAQDERFLFLGSFYDRERLRVLRYYSRLYFHGHSVGGTNPSLLEAMAESAFVCAHENEFNRHVLHDSAVFFKNIADVKSIFENIPDKTFREKCIKENLKTIEVAYSWERINSMYESTLLNEIRARK